MSDKPDIEYDGSAPLKVQQERVISNILAGMSDWDAYSKAGYKAKNPTAGAIQLRKNNKFAARLAYRRAELARKMGITEQKVVNELAKLAFSNMQDFVYTDADGNFHFKDWEELSREQLAAVESIKITETTTTNKKGDREYTTKHVNFKLHSKTANLEQLGRHLGIFVQDNEQKRQQLQINVVNYADSEPKKLVSSNQPQLMENSLTTSKTVISEQIEQKPEDVPPLSDEKQG